MNYHENTASDYPARYCIICNTRHLPEEETCILCDADLSRHKIVRQRRWDVCANTISDRIPTSASVLVVDPLDPQEFPRFQELPIELRFQIWNAALPGPRIVHLETARCAPTRPQIIVKGDPSFLDRRVNTSPCFGFRSSSAMPVLLACRESYRIGACIYTKAFGSDGAFPETWFDFKQDTLYLDWDSPILDAGNVQDGQDAPMPTHARQVQHLAILASPGFYQTTEFLHNILFLFGNIKTLSLILKRHCCELDDLAMMDPFDFDAKVDLLEYPDDEIIEEKYNEDRNQYLGEAHNSMELDTYALNSLWRHSMDRDGIPDNMPAIAIKIMTTRRLKEAFETADCQYLENKGRFHGPRRSRMSLVCQTRYTGEHHLLVTSTTPISQIIQAISAIRFVPPDLKLFLEFDGAWLDSESLVGNLGLESHDRVDIHIRETSPRFVI